MSAGNKCFLLIGHHWMWRRLAGTLSTPSLVVSDLFTARAPGPRRSYLPTGSNEEPWAGTDPNLALAQERIINVTVFSKCTQGNLLLPRLTHFHNSPSHLSTLYLHFIVSSFQFHANDLLNIVLSSCLLSLSLHSAP